MMENNNQSRDKTQLQQAFQDAYASLNADQKEAVDTIEGPVMVIAGPGTGKTQVLTLRIANILLTTDVAPEQILALTFTDAGATAMRERLHRYIGSAAYRVPIHTFHSFAGGLIAQFPDRYQNVIGGRPASEIDKIRMFEQLLDDPSLKIIRTVKSPYHNLAKVRDIISKLKQEYVTPDRFSSLIDTQASALNEIEQFHTKGPHKDKPRREYLDAQAALQKNQELLQVYRQYEALLHEQKLFDFDDMLLETVDALKRDEMMRLEVQETYQYVLADEHQDVNGVQNELLDLIVSYHKSPNIFVVGDEKQAIFRFQGASIENFLYFSDRYDDCKVIQLTKNYRSVQPILDIAQELISIDDDALMKLRVPLASQITGDAVIEERQFSHQAVEDQWVVEQVKGELTAGVPPAEIAVLVRHNASVEQITALLRQTGVPVTASAESDILSHPITQAVVDLLTIVGEPHNELAWFKVLNAPYAGLSLSDVAKLMQHKSYDRPLATVIAGEVERPALTLDHIESLQLLVASINAARDLTATNAPQRVLESLITTSGLVPFVMREYPIEGVRIVRRLYDEVERLVIAGDVRSISDLIRTFGLYKSYGLALSAPFINTTQNAVAVMSAHKSKGLEFTSVIMPRLVDAAWGVGRNSNYFTIPLNRLMSDSSDAQLDDERRLLYVAITRAKERLFISYAETNSDGRAMLRSRLFDELTPDRLTPVDVTPFELAFDPVATLSAQRTNLLPDADALTSLFSKHGFSATSFNNYLQSPYTYLYQNLLRIPKVQAPALQFGTVVHNVLERVIHTHSVEGSLPSSTAIKSLIETELGKLPLSTDEFANMHSHAFESIIGYLHVFAKDLPKEAIVEKKIEVALATGLQELPHVRLTGKLDRIDLGGDGRAVCVVDYKTGTPKSRNDIEGKTKHSDGNYKRQLVFYALLLQLYDDDRYKTRNMTLSFVEPNRSGKYKEEQFVISDEEITSLKQEIITAVTDIVSGNAWKTPCDSTVCEYCDLIATIRN